MPVVTATPRGTLNGEVVTEFTDVTSTTSVTYTYPVQQAGIMIENSGVSDIYVTVGSYTNQVINPDKKWRADASFTSFSIRSNVNSQEFIATSFLNDVEGSGVADLIARGIANKASVDTATQTSSFSKNTICLAGDSLTALNGLIGDMSTSKRLQAEGYFNWANIFLNQRFQVLNNAAVSGYRTDQILAELDANVIAYQPRYCMIMIGINDLLQDIPSATIIANLQSLYNKLRNAGIKIIASPILPCGGVTTAQQITSTIAVNKFIQLYALNNNGFHLVDMGKYFVDSATGNPLTGYTYDGVTHQNQKGAFYLGKALYEGLQDVIPEIPQFSISNKITSSLITTPNPMMLGDVSGVATGYTLTNQGTVTASKVVRTDISGEIQRLVSSATTASDNVYGPTSNFDIVAGDTISMQIEFEVSNLTSIKKIYAQLSARNVSNATIYTSEAMYDTHPGTYTLDSSFKGTIKTQPFVVPIGGVRGNCNMLINLQGTLDIKKWEVIKL